MASSDFARVIFHIQKDTFPPNMDVTFEFEVTPQLEATTWDWVGIFPVGWKNVNKEYHTYQWVLLNRYEKGQRYFTSVKFDASTLPQDKNFYQICYVSSGSRSVCGASDAIQFLDSVGRDFVALECDDMTVIRGKSDVMQEEIQSLAHKLMLVNKEREGLQKQVTMLKKQLEKREEENADMMATMGGMIHEDAEKQSQIQALEKELAKTMAKLSAVQEERDQLEKALNKEQLHVAGLDLSLTSLREGCKKLLSEKDALSGENKCLKDERDSYIIQVTESQTQVSQQSKTIEKLNENLAMAQNKESELVDECEHHKATVASLREQYKDHDRVINELVETQKSEYELTAELANCNDKLAASEELKKKLIIDLEAYEQTQQKMSTKFENQESILRSLQAQVEKKTLDCAELTNKVKTLQVEYEHQRQEAQMVQSTLCQSQAEAHHAMLERKAFEADLEQLGYEHEDIKQGFNDTCERLNDTCERLKQEKEEKQALKAQLLELQTAFHQHSAAKEEEIAVLKQYEARAQCLDEMLESEARTAQENADMKLKLDQSEEFNSYLQALHEEQQETIQKLDQAQSNLHAEITELQKAVTEGEMKLKQQQEQEEASHFCLTKANVALSTRVMDNEKAMAKMKQALSEEVIRRQAAEEMVADLRQRLEMGKLEYQDAAQDNQRLIKKIKHLEKKLNSKGFSADGGSDSDVDPIMMPRLLAPRIKKARAVPVKCADTSTSTDSEREEDSRPQQSLKLKFGNPYSNTENTPPSQQTIIRSTLEEEPVARKSWEETETEEDEEEGTEAETEGETEAEADAEGPAHKDNPLTTESQQEESEGKELPPPMEPQVVSPVVQEAAPAAGAEAAAEEEADGGQEVFEDCYLAADDSFLDAIGEGMKICMICHACILAPDDYEEHMAEHVGRVCPVCHAMADDTMTPQDFQQHVNKCLDKDSKPQPQKDE